MQLWKIAGCVLLLTAPGLAACGRESSPAGKAHAPDRHRTPDVRSAQRFTQAFYDWYVPFAAKQHGAPWADLAAHRPHALSAGLARALKEDAQAQDSAQGESVGLDFDPILDSQDPCARYVAGPATRSGAGYRVSVYSVCDGKKGDGPDVVVELVPRAASWTITDFHYPRDDSDLLDILRLLKEHR